MTATRRRAEARGRRAEMLAAVWLMAKGYRIIARRYRSPLGELDLVARRGKVLAFVEVKQRAHAGDALIAVGPKQQQRLVRAAAAFRARHRAFAELQPRFDLMVITPGRWPEHLRGAWRLEGRDALTLS